MSERAAVVDLVFDVSAGALPGAPQPALAAAVEAALPWLATTPLAGLHPLAGVSADATPLPLSRRARLVLRLPRACVPAALAALQGRELRWPGGWLQLGAARCRELLPWSTLYAACVAAPADADELAFLHAAQAELDALEVGGRTICGLARRDAAGRCRGRALMVDQLDAAASLRLQAHGIGPDRRLGCGLFVPYRSAAAVGAPA